MRTDWQVVRVGRPQLEISLTRHVSEQKKIKTILYAPTWEGFVEEANYSSVSQFGYNVIRSLLSLGSDTTILFKPHPYTGYMKEGEATLYLEKIRTLSKKSARLKFIEPTEDLFKLMNASDILIADISSVLIDYLFTNKPIVLTIPKKIAVESLVQSFPSSKAAYVLPEGTKGVEITHLIKSIEEDDFLSKTRLEVAESYLSLSEGSALSRFDKVVSQV